MRFSRLVTAFVCAWLVACGGSSHKKALMCDASECGPEPEAGAAGEQEIAGRPSSGGKGAGGGAGSDVSRDAGAGGVPSEAAGSGGDDSELQIVIAGNGTVGVGDAAACLDSPCRYPASP